MLFPLRVFGREVAPERRNLDPTVPSLHLFKVIDADGCAGRLYAHQDTSGRDMDRRRLYGAMRPGEPLVDCVADFVERRSLERLDLNHSPGPPRTI